MSELYIRQALETRLSALTPAIVEAHENVRFDPAVDAIVDGVEVPYQRVTLMLNPPVNYGQRNEFRRYTGYLQVDLYYPIGVGAGDAGARAKALEDWFYRGLSVTANNVTTVIDATPSIAPGRTEGTRYVKPVAIRFYCNIMS